MPRPLEVRDYDSDKESLEHGLLTDDLYENVVEVIAQTPEFQKAVVEDFFSPFGESLEEERPLYALYPDREIEYDGPDGNLVIVGIKNDLRVTPGRSWVQKAISYKTRGVELLIESDYQVVGEGNAVQHQGDILLRDLEGYQIASGLEALARSAEIFPELRIEVPVVSETPHASSLT